MIYFIIQKNEQSLSSWCQLIRRLATDRTEIIKKASVAANSVRHFTWDDTAREFIQAMKSIGAFE